MKRFLRPAAVAALFALSACGGAGSAGSTPSPGAVLPASAGSSTDFTARLPENSLGGIPCFLLNVLLFDAPLTFGKNDQVNLAVLGVNLVGTNGVSHPMYTFPTPVVVDLLTLKKKAQQFQTKVTPGTYRAIEFIVLPAMTSVVVSGRSYPVRFGKGLTASPVPIALDSPVTIVGVNKAKVNVDIDFNALESVSLSGGVAQIDPHFVSSTEESQVHGAVRNAQGNPVVSATVLVKDQKGKVVNSSVTDEDGEFLVHALPSGKLTVAVQNTYTSASGVTVSARNATSANPKAIDVQLAAGVDLDLGTLDD
ncbi:MAG: Carboxypeptidase regulatory-like domain [Candidatus Eremiobacteraeota bacterium]|jgi:hypothetical protein|nr:Carboxypeptidase regulatory-like domain [Candidatus Eremiobacteraeota bacterium]